MTARETEEVQFYFDAEMQSADEFLIAGGTATVFSTRCPGKESANEDAAAVVPVGADAALLIVADGVGGFAAGEQAAKLAVKAIAEATREVAESESSLRTCVLNGIELANRRVLEQGMGSATTVALVEIFGREARPYHVGDSMILTVGGRGRPKWQTIPHSPVGYGVESGLLDEEDAMHHEERHLVSNVIGTDDMRIDVGPMLKMAPRDTVLIASDGLCDNLLPEEIREIIRRGPLVKATQKLVALARERMSQQVAGQPCKPDDLTVLLFRPRQKSKRKAD